MIRLAVVLLILAMSTGCAVPTTSPSLLDQYQRHMLLSRLKRVARACLTHPECDPLAGLELGVELSPRDPELYELWGRYLGRSGHLTEALKLALHGTEIDPGFAGNWVLLGEVYIAQRQDAEGKTAFERARSIRPLDVGVRRALGAVDTAHTRGFTSEQQKATIIEELTRDIRP